MTEDSTMTELIERVRKTWIEATDAERAEYIASAPSDLTWWCPDCPAMADGYYGA